MPSGAVTTMAPAFEKMFWFMVILCGFTAALIIGLLIAFSVIYRRRPGHTESKPIKRKKLIIETIWIGVPLITFLCIFAWGARIYFQQMQAPMDSLQMYSVGQQWMWKFQHPEGPREINELHVPIDQPVMVTLTSQDVIHSFFVPPFHIKMDALPERYTQAWFEAKKPGKYRIFCSQYCGTWHSRMTGFVIAMTPQDYQKWLAESHTQRMAAQGQKIFQERGCIQCHGPDSHIHAPDLHGTFGSRLRLVDGTTDSVDENFIHQMIFNPGSHIIRGYANIMPTYKHQLSEEDVNALIEYIKSLSTGFKDNE